MKYQNSETKQFNKKNQNERVRFINGDKNMYNTYHEIPFEEMQKLQLIAEKAKDLFIKLPFFLESFTESVRSSITEQLSQCSKVDENGEDDDRPILQYWLVRSTIYGQTLKAIGEPIAEIDNAIIWGRRTLGTGLMHDYAYMRAVAVASGKLKTNNDENLWSR
jgi:hypothetical protein